MSTSAKRFLPGLLITVILLICVGLLGFILGRQNGAAVTATNSALVTIEKPLTIDQPYQIIQPSVGLLQTTVPVTFNLVEGNVAYFTQIDPRFQPGMSLLLYDQNDECAPKKATLSSIKNDTATVELPPSGLSAVRGDVIVQDNFMARRLPNAARAGDHFWKAVPTPEGHYVIEVVEIGTVQSNSQYFDASGYVRSDEFVIANPDELLRPGATLTQVSLIQSDAPTIDAQEVALQRASDAYVAKLIETINMSPPPPDKMPDGISCVAPAAIPAAEIY